MDINRREFLHIAGVTASSTLFSSFTNATGPGLSLPGKDPDGIAAFPPKPSIILRSSWNDGNIGDQGHTPGMIRLLYRYFPGCAVKVWHIDPRPVTEAMVLRHFPDVTFLRGNFFENGQPMDPVLQQAFEQADLFMVNSGMSMNFGMFNTDWPGNMAGLSPFFWCKEHGIPFGIYGQSFDKLLHPSMEVYRNILSQADFVYCRERLSLKFLQENQFRTPELAFAPDAVFGIDVRNEEKGLAYLRETRLEERKFLAVVIRTNTPPLHIKGGTIDPAHPSPEQQEQDNIRSAKIRDMIVQWIRRTGMKVLLSPETDKEIRAAKTLIYDLLPADVQAKTVWRNSFWDVDEAMSIYARAHTVFGVEPHSLIMALTMGVPILHAWPALKGRKYFMFSDIGLPEWLFPLDESSSEQWLSVLMQNVKNYPAAQAKVASAMKFVRQRQAETIQYIGQHLKRQPANSTASS
jgi:polysaccharide pyruvyl transferase WcaK-like protein